MGNISLKLVGGLVTIATLAAVYFFIVKPVSDTTSDAFDSIAPVVKDVQDQVKEAQEQAAQASKQGGAQQNQANKLNACVQRAKGDVDKLQRCVEKSGF